MCEGFHGSVWHACQADLLACWIQKSCNPWLPGLLPMAETGCLYMIQIYYSGGWCWWLKYSVRAGFFFLINSEDKLHFVSVYRTVRTWDLNSEKKHKSVFKPRSLQGKKVIPTCCTYSRDGKLIAAGCQDGTIQIWDRNLSVSLQTHANLAP